MPEGTFQPIVYNRFSGGLVTSRDATALAPNESPDLQNIEFDEQGSFQPRRGFELMGDRNVTAGKVLRMWTFKRPISNDEILVRQILSDAGTATLQYLHQALSTWQTLTQVGTLAVDGTRMGFANYTASADTEDYMYLCDGSINLQRWTGGNTQLNGALAGGEATITVDSTSGFSTAASIMIGSTTVTYTGKTATTFTGCVGTPAAADNAVVSQKCADYAAAAGTKPKGNILEVFNGQLAVAVKQFVYLSDVDNFAQWSTGLYDSKGFPDGRIKGMKVKDKKLIIGTENGVYAIEYQFTNDLTGQQLNTETIIEAPGYGVGSALGIISVDEEVLYVAKDATIRQLTRAPLSSLFDVGNISKNIYKNFLENFTITNASIEAYKNQILVACQSDESTIHDTVLVFDSTRAQENPTKEAWTRWPIYANDFCVYGGNLYFGSSADMNTYRLFTSATGGTDLHNDDGAAIVWYYKTPQGDMGVPQNKHTLNKVVSKGYANSLAEITYSAAFDFGISGQQDITLLGTTSQWFFQPFLAATGEVTVGEEETDSVDPFNGKYPFVYPFSWSEYHGYNSQITMSGQTKNEEVKITHLILYAELQADEETN